MVKYNNVTEPVKDTLVETAKYLTSFLKTGVVILTGAKLPEGKAQIKKISSQKKN